MGELIVNNQTDSHLKVLAGSIREADEVWIAVAFFKETGFEQLKPELEYCLKKGGLVRAFCGLDYYLTEPNALRGLHSLLEHSDTSRLYLCHSNKYSYHPKVYCCVTGNEAVVLVGSANLTGGGLQKNVEVSVLESTSKESPFFRQVDEFFSKLESLKGTEEANEFSIGQYEGQYQIYKKRVQRAQKEAVKEIHSGFNLKHSEIGNYVQEYKKDEGRQHDWRRKTKNYEEARNELDALLSEDIDSRQKFMSHYEKLVGAAGEVKLWYSGSIFRQKNSIAPHYRTFIKMLCEVREKIEANAPGPEVFDVGLHYVKRISGLGVNVLTEVMNTYRPDRYAVLNNNPLASLKHFKFTEFPPPNTFKPDTYDRYNSLIKMFARTCGFQDLSQVDHFLDFVYWRHVKRKPHP